MDPDVSWTVDQNPQLIMFMRNAVVLGLYLRE